LGPIEPQPSGLPRIEVTFLIDANGILNVTARDQRTGREHSVDVKPSYGLTDDEIERMLEESIELGEGDIEQRLLINARNEANHLLTALAKQLKDYGELIDSRERQGIEQAAAELESVRSSEDRTLIAHLVEQLNELTTPFAERIMNHAISQALEKKSIEELS
jgi:molecular chaperone DnaK (HSP70)